jgi:PAS domain S-box-containing protein
MKPSLLKNQARPNPGIDKDFDKYNGAGAVLRESEARYKSLFTSMHEGFALGEIIRDEAGIPVDVLFVEANPAYEVQTGRPITEVVGHRLSEVVVQKEVCDRWLKRWVTIDQTGDPLRIEDQGAEADRWYQVMMYKVSDGHVAALFEDISERKRAEEERHRLLTELSAERSRLQGIIKGIAEEVWICDAQGRISLLHRPPNTLMGLEEFKEKSVEDIYKEVEVLNVDGSPRSPEQSPLLRSLVGETVRGEEIMIHRRTGQKRHRLYSSAPIRDASGAIIGAVAVARDITELHEAREALRQAKEEWERTFDSVPDLIAILDADHGIVRVNKAMAERLGQDSRKLAGQHCYECMHGTSEPPKGCPHELTMRDKKAHSAELFEKRLGGDYLVTTTPLQDEQGRMIGTVHIAHDISIRKQAEREIQNLNATLEQRVRERTAELTAINAELETFTYSVSHDLRSPLRHIIAFADLLKQSLNAPADSETAGYIKNIETASSRMASLIEDLLEFSRIGQVELKRESVDLRSLVNDVITGLALQIEGRKIDWQIGPLPNVLADAPMVQQVFLNLIDNALKFTRHQEIARIEVGSRQETNAWVIYVRDNGVGFDPAYQAKLFGVFQRLHSRTQFEGTGVGLAIVRRAVQRHSGHTWAESEEGRGSTFYFSLPITPPESDMRINEGANI